jgi:hypothetical protein
MVIVVAVLLYPINNQSKNNSGTGKFHLECAEDCEDWLSFVVGPPVGLYFSSFQHVMRINMIRLYWYPLLSGHVPYHCAYTIG